MKYTQLIECTQLKCTQLVNARSILWSALDPQRQPNTERTRLSQLHLSWRHRGQLDFSQRLRSGRNNLAGAAPMSHGLWKVSQSPPFGRCEQGAGAATSACVRAGGGSEKVYLTHVQGLAPTNL